MYQLCAPLALKCVLLSSQGRDGNVKFWQLDASLASIKQKETQIITGAFSFCRCATAPVQVCVSVLLLCTEPFWCSPYCLQCGAGCPLGSAITFYISSM